LIAKPVGEVQPGPIRVEDQILRVEIGLEFADHCIGPGVDHAREIRELVQQDDVRSRVDGGVEG
jgi:hypothetical protein